MKYKPCPPTPRRKDYVTEYLKRKIDSKGDGIARPIYFNYPSILFQLFCKPLPYLNL